MLKLIACAHPGRIGDALHALPAIKRLCEIHDAKADFFVRPWCEPARDLIEYQPYINKMRTDAPVHEVPKRLQPLTEFRDREKYAACVEVSWTRQHMHPLSESLAEEAFLPREVGRDYTLDIPLGLPDHVPQALGRDYVALAIRRNKPGERVANEYIDLFHAFVSASPWPIIEVGQPGTGFIGMAQVIARAKAFVGTFSAPLTVAQAFEIPKTCVFDGAQWWPHQILKDGETEYLAGPTVGQIIESLNRTLRVKRV